MMMDDDERCSVATMTVFTPAAAVAQSAHQVTMTTAMDGLESRPCSNSNNPFDASFTRLWTSSIISHPPPIAPIDTSVDGSGIGSAGHSHVANGGTYAGETSVVEDSRYPMTLDSRQ